MAAADKSVKFLEETIVMVEANRAKFEHIDAVLKRPPYRDTVEMATNCGLCGLVAGGDRKSESVRRDH